MAGCLWRRRYRRAGREICMTVAPVILQLRRAPLEMDVAFNVAIIKLRLLDGSDRPALAGPGIGP